MMQDKIGILSTRPLDDSLLLEAAAAGILVDAQSFIHAEPVTTVEIQQEIENALMLSATVVFTSANAVEVVAEQMYDNLPDWRIYCIGQATKQLVAKYFGAHTIGGTADNAAALAELIIEESPATDIYFFCGDQRRDELPRLLSNEGIQVNEVVVYQTIAIPRKLEKHYHGILFFSPSGVKSFFSVNKITADTVLFSIGETTAEEIKKFTGNKVIIAKEPSKEELVREVVMYFGV